jgi:hypothetical protein
VNSLEKYAAKRLLIVKLGSLWGRLTGAKQTGWEAAKANPGQVVSNVGAWDQGAVSYPRRGGEFKPVRPDPHLRPSLARHPGVQAAQPAAQPAVQPAAPAQSEQSVPTAIRRAAGYGGEQRNRSGVSGLGRTAEDRAKVEALRQEIMGQQGPTITTR